MSAANLLGSVDLAQAATRLHVALSTIQRRQWRESHGLVDAACFVTADQRCVELTEESVREVETVRAADREKKRLRKAMTRPRWSRRPDRPDDSTIHAQQ